MRIVAWSRILLATVVTVLAFQWLPAPGPEASPERLHIGWQGADESPTVKADLTIPAWIDPPQSFGCHLIFFFAPDPFRLTDRTNDPATANLRVIVTDSKGKATPGATMRLIRVTEGGKVTATASQGEDGRVAHDEQDVDSEGRVEIASLKPGRVRVLVRAGALTRGAEVKLVGGRVTELAVVIPAHKTTIEGTARHVEKGVLKGATLRFRRVSEEVEKGWLPDSLSVVTNDRGRYRIEAVPPGTYSLSLQDALGARARPLGEVVVKHRGTTKHDCLVGIVNVQGTVIDTLEQRPLPQVKVSLSRTGEGKRPTRFWHSTHTDSEGRFRFMDVPAGEYRLSFSKDGYGVHWENLGKIPAGKGKRTVDVRLEPAAVLHVRIMDAEGNPVSGTFILVAMKDSEREQWEHGGKAASQPHSIQTDEKGSAVLKRLPPGEYRFWTLRPASEILRKKITPGENEICLKLKAP